MTFLKRLSFLVLALSWFLAASPVYSSHGAVSKITSSLISAPLGGFFGLARGAISKSSQYASSFSTEFGEGLLPRLVGVPSGFLIGGVAGGATGLLRGVINGVRISQDSPFSAAAMSLDGDFIDFDPYDFNATY
jgi:hypothetical protein